jgi:hypothetical protein
MLVGLTGYAGSGKNAAAEGLVASGWSQLSFAEPIRQMLLVLNPIIHAGIHLQTFIDDQGWDETKYSYPEVRRLMQVLGTEVGRDMIDDDLWVKLAKKTMEDCFKQGKPVVFTDCRFPNEVEMIRFNGGKIIRIHREGTKPAQNHVSDTNVDLLPVDREIINSGTVEDLQNALKSILGIA